MADTPEHPSPVPLPGVIGPIDVDAPVPGGPPPPGWGSHELLRGLFDQAPIAMSLIELGEREVRANAAYLKLFGFDDDGAPELDATKVTHPADREETARLFLELLGGRIDRIETEKRYIRVDGTTFWGQHTATLLRDDEGAPWAILNVCRDVTAQHEAAHALAESESRFRSLVQNTQDAIVVLDAVGNFTYASPAATRLFGRTAEELVGTSSDTCVHPDDLEVVARRFLSTASRHSAESSLRHRVIDAAGVVHQVESVGSNLLHDPAVRGVVVNMRVVSGLERIETAIEVSEGHFRTMVQHIADAVSLIDAEGRVEAGSAEENSLLGYSASYWRTHSAWDVVHPDDLPMVAEQFVFLLEHPGEQVRSEFRALAASGAEVVVDTSAVNLLDDPAVGAIVLTVRDISDRKQIERELAEARDRAVRELELRTEFIASVSHELRTPIHGVLGLSELLHTTPDLPAAAHELAGSIEKATRALQIVLDDLLDFAKIESGRLALTHEPVDLVELVDEVVALYAPSAERRGVITTVSFAAEVSPRVVADGFRLRQILSNLISNALKFTSEGEVAISVRRCENSPSEAVTTAARTASSSGCPVVIEVRDTGIGIAEETIDRLFEPFSQAYATTSRDFGGTGLGLAVSRQLAELMGGSIEVRSELGSGSVFTVTLPLSAAEEVTRPITTPTPTRPAGGTGHRVLVVEDNAVNRLLVSHQLARLGYEAVVVENGLEALDRFGELDPDAVLMDCQLPGFDGLETTRRLRELEAQLGWTRRPVIALTANALPGERARCVEAGMDDLVAKPVGLDVLGRVLGSWLDGGDGVTTAHAASEGREVSPAQSEAVFDEGVVDGLIADLGDRDPVDAMVRAYRRELPARLDDLEHAVAGGDDETLVRIAHTLRSTSAAVGTHRLAEAAGSLERAAGEANPDRSALAAMVGALAEQSALAMRALTRWSAQQSR